MKKIKLHCDFIRYHLTILLNGRDGAIHVARNNVFVSNKYNM